MTSELIEKLNALTSAVIEHRQETEAAKRAMLEDLEVSVKKFYDEVFERYGTLLENTRKIHNALEQYRVRTKYGDLSMGLALTGFFSSIAGWSTYSNTNFHLSYRNASGFIDLRNKEGLSRLRDFLNNVDWADFDKQITEQAVKLFGQYEDETLKEEL